MAEAGNNQGGGRGGGNNSQGHGGGNNTRAAVKALRDRVKTVIQHLCLWQQWTTAAATTRVAAATTSREAVKALRGRVKTTIQQLRP